VGGGRAHPPPTGSIDTLYVVPYFVTKYDIKYVVGAPDIRGNLKVQVQASYVPTCFIPLPYVFPFALCPLLYRTSLAVPPTPVRLRQHVVDQDGSVELLPIEMFHVEGK